MKGRYSYEVCDGCGTPHRLHWEEGQPVNSWQCHECGLTTIMGIRDAQWKKAADAAKGEGA